MSEAVEKKYYRMVAGARPFDPGIGPCDLTDSQAEQMLLEIEESNRFGYRTTMREMNNMKRVKNFKVVKP